MSLRGGTTKQPRRVHMQATRLPRYRSQCMAFISGLCLFTRREISPDGSFFPGVKIFL